jgi:TPR repeat protein
MCFEGMGGPKDVKDAVRYYRIAHNASYGTASCDLATLYAEGRGVEKNLEEAIRIYRQAAHMGCVEAKLNLGLLYHRTEKIRDLVTAARLFREAAEEGSLHGKVWLASYTKDGKGGISANPARARAMYKEVADKSTGRPDATVVGRASHNYATMCADGVGGPQDLLEALSYFGRAAVAGVVKAALRYAELTVNPKGLLTVDRARAEDYLTRAIGDPPIDVACRPTREDRTKARQLLMDLG